MSTDATEEAKKELRSRSCVGRVGRTRCIRLSILGRSCAWDLRIRIPLEGLMNPSPCFSLHSYARRSKQRWLYCLMSQAFLCTPLYTIRADPIVNITATASAENAHPHVVYKLRPPTPQTECSQTALRAMPAQSIQTPAHTLHMGPLLQDL